MEKETKKKIIIDFEPAWLIQNKDKVESMPNEVLISALEKKFKDIKIISSSMMECCVVVNEELVALDVLEGLVFDSIKLEDASSNIHIKIEDYIEEIKEEKEEKEEPSIFASISNKETIKSEDIRKKINDLVGCTEFKVLTEELVAVSKQIIKFNAVKAFSFQNYLFSINNGYGLTTCLNLFADLVNSLKLYDFGNVDKVNEVKLEPITPNSSNPFDNILSIIKGCKNSLVCIDICEWMNKVYTPEFKRFLMELEDFKDECLFIFRIPFVEKETLDNVSKNLNDVLYTRSVTFTPFDSEELLQCAVNYISSFGFTLADDAKDIFNIRMIEEKSDGRFYGINTANKVSSEMIYHKLLSNIKNDKDDAIISKSDIEQIIFNDGLSNLTGMEMLNNLVGIDSIKAKINELVEQIKFSLNDKSVDRPCIHMRFVGGPGTGKTTVARILGRILKDSGILRIGNFFEFSGRDFCGRYVGETAPKTSAICRDAYGSVLFIDEAYSLYRTTKENNDFGREALDTLIAEMEAHRNDMVVIMAGYNDEMETLMKGNIGLASRMPYKIEFPNYSREILYKIFMKMASSRFKYSQEFEEVVKNYFTSLSDEFINSKEFSNARYVRNLYERTWGKTILRSQLNKISCPTLEVEDFNNAVKENEFTNIMEKKSRSVGFL